MKNAHGYLKSFLHNLRAVREKAGISASELEERLILGPGWITRFETGETVPSIDMLLAILHETDSHIGDLSVNLPTYPDAPEVERYIFAEEVDNDLIIHFRYAKHDATYILEKATNDEFEEVIKTLRDGLSGLGFPDEESLISEAIKREAVTAAFLNAARMWPHANPSDLWYFVIYRAYCDPYNHPARFARLAFEQSWKRTSGWALEEILVRHYGPFLKRHGINLFIADSVTKQNLLDYIDVDERLEADKMDVLITAEPGNRFLGVVHVKASFAERRTDDVPMSAALGRAGYLSPFWTMDCKSTPSKLPINRGELGSLEGRRSAKRMDIEDEGYFTGCFSYNHNTIPSPNNLPPKRRIYICDFNNPDDDFSKFIIEQGKRSLNS